MGYFEHGSHLLVCPQLRRNLECRNYIENTYILGTAIAEDDEWVAQMASLSTTHISFSAGHSVGGIRKRSELRRKHPHGRDLVWLAA